MRIARESGTNKDERAAKNTRNIHSRKIKSRLKEYHKNEFENDKNKYKSLKELQEDKDKSPTTNISNGKEISSPEEIANKMAETSLDKVVKIRNDINGNNFEAINIYKRLIPILKVISN